MLHPLQEIFCFLTHNYDFVVPSMCVQLINANFMTWLECTFSMSYSCNYVIVTFYIKFFQADPGQISSKRRLYKHFDHWMFLIFAKFMTNHLNYLHVGISWKQSPCSAVSGVSAAAGDGRVLQSCVVLRWGWKDHHHWEFLRYLCWVHCQVWGKLCIR